MTWLSDFFLGIAWLAIVLIPAFVASRQPVVSHNGYLKNYMDPAAHEGGEIQAGEPVAEA